MPLHSVTPGRDGEKPQRLIRNRREAVRDSSANASFALVQYERLKLLGLSSSVPYEPLQNLDAAARGVNLKPPDTSKPTNNFSVQQLIADNTGNIVENESLDEV